GGRRRCHAPSWVQYSPPGRINMLRNATFSGFWRSFHPPSAIGHLSSAIRHLSSAIPPSPFPVPHSAFSRERKKVGGPWYVVSLREFLLLTAPSGLLCGNWDFSSSFSRRCSHGYQMQVKSSSIAALSHHRQAFRIAPPAGPEGRPRALRYRGRGLCQGSFQVDARQFLRPHPHPTQRGRTQQAGL